MTGRGAGQGKDKAGRGRHCRAYQVIQGPLSGVELNGAWAPHVWGAEQVGDGEVEGEWHQFRTHTCSWRERKGRPITVLDLTCTLEGGD